MLICLLLDYIRISVPSIPPQIKSWDGIILKAGIVYVSMNWHERIVADPGVLVGKPVIRGTRMAVEFVLDLLANGWSEAEIIKNYPRLTTEDIQACIGYASALLKSERVYPIKVLQEGI